MPTSERRDIRVTTWHQRDSRSVLTMHRLILISKVRSSKQISKNQKLLSSSIFLAWNSWCKVRPCCYGLIHYTKPWTSHHVMSFRVKKSLMRIDLNFLKFVNYLDESMSAWTYVLFTLIWNLSDLVMLFWGPDVCIENKQQN